MAEEELGGEVSVGHVSILVLLSLVVMVLVRSWRRFTWSVVTVVVPVVVPFLCEVRVSVVVVDIPVAVCRFVCAYLAPNQVVLSSHICSPVMAPVAQLASGSKPTLPSTGLCCHTRST